MDELSELRTRSSKELPVIFVFALIAAIIHFISR